MIDKFPLMHRAWFYRCCRSLSIILSLSEIYVLPFDASESGHPKVGALEIDAVYLSARRASCLRLVQKSCGP
jgi:hypothetical protein